MKEQSPIALAATLHDPENRILPIAEASYELLRQTYPAMFIAATRDTSERLISGLLKNGAQVTQENRPVGEGRRQALRLGLKSDYEFFHYCDFDRVLHWLNSYPQELIEVVFPVIREYDYLIIGRTSRAFLTHPEVQQTTEGLTNRIFSIYWGQEVDVTTGSCGVNRTAAELVLPYSVASSNATDTEWPTIIKEFGKRAGVTQVEGLEFETPDFYQVEIEAAGSLEKWVERRYNCFDVWQARLRLTLKSAEAIQRILEITKEK